jgi:CubicO group peptidase (beta-lactamase class C family)
MIGIPKCLRVFPAALALVVSLSIQDLRGQTSARSNDLVSDNFLKSWKLLGPIPLPGNSDASPGEEVQRKAFDTDFLAPCGTETGSYSLSPPACKINGQDHSWKQVQSGDDIVDLAKELGPKTYAVAYALTEVESSAAGSVLFGVGSDDAVKVWLNGKLVHANWIQRALQKDQDLVLLELQPGKNQLLIKIQNGIGDWSFAGRALGAKALEELLWTAAKNGDVDRLQTILRHGNGIQLNSGRKYDLTAWQIARIYGRADATELLAAKGADTTLPLPKPEALVDRMLSDLTKGQSPGAAVLVSQNGQVLFSKGYGFASLEPNVPITPQTKFRIGSITKQFTAAAILRLQEQGKLSVNDPLSKFIPDYPRGSEVTIHHLLTHTSGIHSYTEKPDFLQSVLVGIKPEDLIKSFKNDRYDFDPGARWAYNNSGYFLLGYIIEKVSGESYEDYLKTQFFDPLGMKDTGVHSSSAILEHEAIGYSYERNAVKKALNWDMSRAGGAGALYSTVNDLNLWNEALFNGKLLKEATLKAAWTPVRTSSQAQPPEPGYGYGWAVGRFRGLLQIQHGGGLHGFVSQLTRYPAEKLTVVVLANVAPPPPGLNPGALANDIAQIYLGEKMESRQSLITSLSVETLDQYVGRYDYNGPILTVTRDGNRLFAQLTGQPRFEIVPKSETEFFWKVVEAQVTFVKDEKGRVIKAIHRQGPGSIEAPRLADAVAIQLEPAVLDSYVGKYDYGEGRVMTVTREGNRLFAQLTDQPRFEIFPKSDTEFFWTAVQAQVSFVKDATGKVIKGIHRQGGQTMEVRKIE